MKLEEGMYVRTKEGTIHKIFKIDKMLKYKKEDRLIINKDDWFLVESDLFKASHNIIDLIEVGDYVNDELVKNIEVDSYKDYVINSGYWCKQEEIKSIITKEQFERMKYEVE